MIMMVKGGEVLKSRSQMTRLVVSIRGIAGKAVIVIERELKGGSGRRIGGESREKSNYRNSRPRNLLDKILTIISCKNK